MRCEDYPCCGHTDGLPCDWTYTPEAQAFDMAHFGCDHAGGWCEADDYDEPDDVDPEDCDHPDTTNTDDWTVRCDVCWSEALRVVAYSWDHPDAPEELIIW